MTATIQKWGNSQAVRLPKIMLDELLLQENDFVDISADKNCIIIKKAARKRRAQVSLEKQFENYQGDYTCIEYDWGEPFGNEVW